MRPMGTCHVESITPDGQQHMRMCDEMKKEGLQVAGTPGKASRVSLDRWVGTGHCR